MIDLLATLIDQRVCVWFAGDRVAQGIFRGVGEGLVCVDLADDAGELVRTFLPLSAIVAIRPMTGSTGEAL